MKPVSKVVVGFANKVKDAWAGAKTTPSRFHPPLSEPGVDGIVRRVYIPGEERSVAGRLHKTIQTLRGR